MLIACSMCFVESEAVPQPEGVSYVCCHCRCADCSIVLNQVCICGEVHGIPSSELPRICTDCANVRNSLATMDPELLAVRNASIEDEEPLCC